MLDEKIIKGVKHFLIRWKGYEADSDTWEPESTLNCSDLIKEFQAKSSSSSSGGTSSPKKEKKKRGRPSKGSTTSVTWSENEEFEVDRILEVSAEKIK